MKKILRFILKLDVEISALYSAIVSFFFFIAMVRFSILKDYVMFFLMLVCYCVCFARTYCAFQIFKNRRK